MWWLLAQSDAGNYGMGSIVVVLLGLLGWVVKESLGRIGRYIDANTKVLTRLSDDVDFLKTDAHEAKVDRDNRPCALTKAAGFTDLLKQLSTQANSLP